MWLKEVKKKKKWHGPIRLKAVLSDRSLNILLQWMFTIIIFNPATDKWMATAPQDFCQGSCDPVDCMPIEKRKMSIFLSASERVGLLWTDKEDTDVVPFSLSFFFLIERKKYLFSNLDSSLSIVWINMLLLSSHFSFFLFPQYPKQMLTHLTMLYMYHTLERKRIKTKKKLNWCLFLQLLSNVGLLDLILGDMCVNRWFCSKV